MGTVHTALPAQTLYVTIRREELRQLKDERDQLKQELAQLRLLIQGQQPSSLTLPQRAPHA
jgi:ribosomal protein L29